MHRLGGRSVLFDLVSSTCSGGCPPEVLAFLDYSRLLALVKPNGGLRPLAVGPAFFRSCGACYVAQRKSDIALWFTTTRPPP